MINRANNNNQYIWFICVTVTLGLIGQYTLNNQWYTNRYLFITDAKATTTKSYRSLLKLEMFKIWQKRNKNRLIRLSRWECKFSNSIKLVSILFISFRSDKKFLLRFTSKCVFNFYFYNTEKNMQINKHNQVLLNKLVEISCGKWSSVAMAPKRIR